ncbi:carbohydrate ABC transporter permease [Streptomyces armeniacus]|uniref:Carbohydrate ABC transporter permease n=1 Tax=Streptomyces armeniacus TaxID=83291 RepID=A0A345XPK2_9ACTN|nr:carbohydrate ABC transporter permease [Streptomyces armeniacus]AXK33568.1 carbohydrate ABC transporter permease [Streptomyces armeniacus]
MLAGHVLAWSYALLLLLPLYYLLTTSLKDNAEVFAHPFSLPGQWLFDNFADAWDLASLGPALGNSVLITAGAEAITLALAFPAAYGLARSGGRTAAVVERIFGIGFLIPAFAALVPTVLLAIELEMFQMQAFLILFLPATALPLSVILLTQFMRTIPAELEESAMMDGAGRWTVLWRIYVPMSAPGVITVAILNFLGFWNEYLFSLVILGPDPELRTVQVALPSLVSATMVQYGILAAACLITLVPVYSVYVALQRRMESALVDGAVKS